MNIYRMILLICLLFRGGAILPVNAFFYDTYERVKCSFNECCNDHYIPQDIQALRRLLNAKVFGQKIATDLLLQALYAHSSSGNTAKALAMSFHGTSGIGKTYVANMIVDAFYKKGHRSQHFHYINGRSDLTLENEVHHYKKMLQKKIVEALLNCPKSLFIFDEIDSMPAGVLNVLVPFLDYGKPRIWSEYSSKFVETRQAIFIFITNAGSMDIMKRLIELRESGESRNATKFADFEDLIAKRAFNEGGGFHKSDTIKDNLIDHYVPFLPLERKHIELCINAAFNTYGMINPTIKQIDEVITHLKFGPEPHNLYSESGCKRIETKVASIVYKRGLHSEL